jgi:endonuclease G
VYEISREKLNKNWAERPNSFRPDPDVRTESATPRDYSNSGYDKGHLCAAADMAFDAAAIEETFLMSNISPQVRAFNGGIWRELEENTRDWARKYGRLAVATGPVLTQPTLGSIGFSKVSVPAAYYKVLYAPEQNIAIGYILPNEVSQQPLDDFACSIDAVEKATGIDFFPKLKKEIPEATFDTDAWPVNRKRYEKRLKEWNRR